MAKQSRHTGFSLTEVLLAVATLAIGMLFVGGTFLAGIYFTTLGTERTIAAVAADEAFAKIRLYGLDVNSLLLVTDQLTAFSTLTSITGEELMYPSTIAPMSHKQYCWAALCRRVSVDGRLVQVTVFISRRAGANTKYWSRQGEEGFPELEHISFPRPILVNVVQDPALHGPSELQIKDAVPTDNVDERGFINDGYTIADNQTGQTYRVLERKPDQPDIIILDRPWQGGAISPPTDGWVWAVPPPISGGGNPCVAVYQKLIRF